MEAGLQTADSWGGRDMIDLVSICEWTKSGGESKRGRMKGVAGEGDKQKATKNNIGAREVMCSRKPPLPDWEISQPPPHQARITNSNHHSSLANLRLVTRYEVSLCLYWDYSSFPASSWGLPRTLQDIYIDQCQVSLPRLVFMFDSNSYQL